MYEKEGKKYPFDINEYYSPSLNSLKRIYTQHPKFNGNVRLIYELLFDHWNAEYGYAFPDQWQLAIDSGMSVSSVGRHLKVLEELELIEIDKSPLGRGNNVYYIKKPIDNITEFYEKFPDIEKKARERIEKIEAEKEKKLEQWSKNETKAGNKFKPGDKFTAIIEPQKKEKEANAEESYGKLSEWL